MANCNRQQLNITCGTDVVLHDKLMFDGEVFDPNVSVDIECSLVNSLGRRTSLEYEIADETLIIQIPWVDGRNAGCYGLEVKGKCNGKTWATYADSLIRYTRATVEGASVVEVSSDWYDITQVVSYRYSDSPLDEVDATIDDNYGEPEVIPTYEHNKLTLSFKNLRGNGIVSVEQTVESTEPEGVNETTITQDNGNTTVFRVRNGKSIVGPKGQTGDSAIFDPTTGNISQMKQGAGDDALSPMSQKAVTDEVTRDIVQISLSGITAINKFINIDNLWATGDARNQCKMLNVQPGELYRLVASDNYSCIFAFLTSEDTQTVGNSPAFADGHTGRERISEGTQTIVTIPSNASKLYVLVTSSGNNHTPHIFKVERLKDSVDTLENKVDENNVIEKQLPTEYTLIDFTINNNGKWVNNDPNEKWALIPVEPNSVYKVLPKSGYYLTYTFLYDKLGISNNADVHFANGYTGKATTTIYETELTAPDNARFLAVLHYLNGSDRYPRSLKKITEVNDVVPVQKKIRVRLERMSLNTSTGGYGYGSYKNGFSTSKMYRTPDDGLVKLTFFNDSTASGFRIFGYDENGKFCYVRNSIPQTKGTPVVVTLPDCQYFKVGIGVDAYSGTTDSPDIVEMLMEGAFPDDYEAYNTPQVTPDSNGNYMIALTLSIDAATPTGQDIETATITDAVNIQFDNGMLALPSTYKADGTPTRLIIFCHGSAKHITPGQTAWPTDAYGVDPTYWLSEGYAVMDMDGLPDDTTTPHWCSPVAYNCMLAAYRHVIANYNICKDGVFLGGRSLGGAMALTIMALEHIPVIACCPFAPAGPESTRAFWTKTAAEKQMIAATCGIYNPDGVAWQQYDFPVELLTMEYATINGNKKYIGNFGRLMQYSPSYRLVVNNPSVAALTNEILFTAIGTDAAKKAALEAYLLEIYGGCAVKTRIPTKFFGAYDDTSVDPASTNLWVRMFRNGGNIIEQRMFPSGGHAFDLANANRVQSFVNSRGNTMSNVPIAYIEALQFWRSYE